MAGTSPPSASRGQSRIFIGADGEVVVENLTPELLEVALVLDPEDARLRAIAGAARQGDPPTVLPAPPATAPSRGTPGST